MSAANSLQGRVALITGASSGIGAATARVFAAAGASLVLTGRDEKKLQGVVASINKSHPTVKIATYIGDAGLESTQKALVDLALSTFGALHIAFNNAGVFFATPLTQIDAKAIDTHFDGNVKSILYGLKYQIPAIAKSATKDNWGSIITNSSVLSSRVTSGNVAFSVYAATKAAVDTITKYGALEGAASFVRVNSVNPGPTASEGVLNMVGSLDAFNQMVGANALSSGPATTEEIAQFVLYLVDNKTGRFFNGSNLIIDGGVNVK